MSSRRRALKLIPAVAAIALLVSSCTNSGDTNTTTDASDSITVAIAAMPTSYDLEGNWAASNENYTLWSQTMVGLLRYKYVETDGVLVQDFNQYEGVLADEDEPYTVSDDGQDYTFHLREGVVSQAGNPFTAQDVYYSIDRKLSVDGGRLNQIKDYFYSIDQLEIVDDYTITFHLDDVGNDNVFLQMLTGQMGRIWDSTEMKAHATTDDPWSEDWAAQNTGAGYGPYDVDSVTADQQVVLTANEDYVLGAPAIKTVTLQVVSDSGTRAQMLASSDVQIAEALTPTDQESIQDDENVQMAEVDNPIEFVDLALVQNKAPFDDKLVRQAFMYAVPYDELIEQIYRGRATTSPGWFTPTMGVPGLSTDPAYTYDIDKAKELLAEAGKSSVDVTLTVSNAIPDIVDAAIMIASYAKDAGFNVTVEQLAPAEFATGRLETTFESMLMSNRSQQQAPSYVRNFFLPGDVSNSGAYVPTDEWLALNQVAIDAGTGTSEEAAPYWEKVNEFINDDASQLPILYRQPNQAYATTLEGMSYRYDNTVDYSVLTPAGS
ncbi:ABC transporter substrate-binding protein [Brooklawnia cerclae]|uniref:Peptide/nickel transport system substrate-binding protein n=1 Tax=Brooklawnia cerclae TaxID=349934 RepID=A0ABX0SGT6_9ACTN|nr:ABC transporter substrate-binding protein [Brooklawnia cerclae]NIH57603.1 peptide/nickel transport system substrate-binding protein [Brooklawnia cerclae]